MKTFIEELFSSNYGEILYIFCEHDVSFNLLTQREEVI